MKRAPAPPQRLPNEFLGDDLWRILRSHLHARASGDMFERMVVFVNRHIKVV
jgi:hypothetical protein